jgi:hypothetical protein
LCATNFAFDTRERERRKEQKRREENSKKKWNYKTDQSIENLSKKN